jgi:hypothetical protein
MLVFNELKGVNVGVTVPILIGKTCDHRPLDVYATGLRHPPMWRAEL